MNMRVSTDHPELPVRSLTVETTVVEIILAIDPKFLAAKLDASVTFIVGAQCGLKITGSSTGVLPERRRILVTARISYIGPLRWPEFGQQNDRVSSCVSAKPLLIVYWPHSPLGLCFPPGSNEPLSSEPSPSSPKCAWLHWRSLVPSAFCQPYASNCHLALGAFLQLPIECRPATPAVIHIIYLGFIEGEITFGPQALDLRILVEELLLVRKCNFDFCLPDCHSHICMKSSVDRQLDDL